MAHAVVHFEIDAADDGSLVAFYKGVFGWTLQDSVNGRHTSIDTRGGGINGGIGKGLTGDAWSSLRGDGRPGATLDTANSLSGTTIMPVTDFDGSMTANCSVTRWSAGRPGAGAGHAARASRRTRRSTVQVMGSDAARTQDFYAELFG
jgi:predicted enzyme related to lactoylglutathione lyase